HGSLSPPPPPLFPYTTLFRSGVMTVGHCDELGEIRAVAIHAVDTLDRDPRPPSLAGLAPLREPGVESVGIVMRHALMRRAAVSKDRKSTRLNSSHQIISYAVF